ncbi:MAG: type III polyketide synthase [Phycisphaeraceae bacterium]
MAIGRPGTAPSASPVGQRAREGDVHGVTLRGLGVARPGTSIEQHAAARHAAERCCADGEQVAWLEQVYRQSSVRQRGSVLIDRPAGRDAHEPTGHDATGTLYEGHAAFYPPRSDAADAGPTVDDRMAAYARYARPLAVAAARDAMREANVAAAEVGQLVVVSCTGFGSPGLDVHLVDALGLPRSVGRTTIGFMGCHGVINGLRVARALSLSQPGSAVLLCAVELCSLHFQYGWDRPNIVANALFADGAAAAVLHAGHELTDSDGSNGGGEAWQVVDTASQLVPDSHEAMTWTITAHGFRMTLSPRVPALIERSLRPWLEPWLAGHGLAIDAVRQWAVHPGGPRVLDAVGRSLGLADAALATSRGVLAECGNMSSPTVLFIAERLRRAAPPGPCVMLAFGPGLMAEAALLVPGGAEPHGVGA